MLKEDIKDYYIDRVKERFFNLKNLDFDTYSGFVRSVLEAINKRCGDNNRDKILYLSLFSTKLVSSIDISQADGKYCVDLIEGIKCLSLDEDKGTDAKESLSFGKASIRFTDKACAYIMEIIPANAASDITVFSGEDFDKATIIAKLANLFPEEFKQFINSHRREYLSDMYFNLAKSITVGEYFILDRYSTRRLDEIVKSPGNTLGGASLQTIYDILQQVQVAVSQIRSVSRTIGSILRNQTSGEKIHPVRVAGFNDFIACSYKDEMETDAESVWIKAIEAISLISYIDFNYIASSRSVETLIASYVRLGRLGKQYSLPQKEFQEVVLPNQVKALIMLKRFLNTSDRSGVDKELEIEFLPQYPWIMDIVQENNVSGIPERRDDFDAMIKDLRVQDEGHNDISRFNKMGQQYLRAKAGRHDIYKLKDKQIEDITPEDLNLIGQKSESGVWTPSLLVEMIRKVSALAESAVSPEIKIPSCNLLRNMLTELSWIIDGYRGGNTVPGKIEAPFKKNYFLVAQVGETYSIEAENGKCCISYDNVVGSFEGKSIMFMQSMSVTPVFLNFQEGFLLKYDRKARNLETEEIRIEKERVLEREKQWGVWERLYKRKESEIDKRLEDYEKTNMQVIKDNQAHSLQLLGILGAFIALVSVGANAISHIQIEQFGSFVFIITICVVVLLLSIHYIFERDEGDKFFRKSEYLMILLMFYLFISIAKLNPEKVKVPVRGIRNVQGTESASCPCRQSQQDSLVLTGKALIFEKE